MFDGLDTNGDGLIDERDYDAVVSMLAARRSLQPETPEYNAVRTKVMAGWEAVRSVSDEDGDGHVTRDEFVRSLTKLSQTDEGLDRLALAIADEMITVMDHDADGRLDLEDFSHMMAAWGAPPERMGDRFRHLDTDGDGYLSREELLASARAFFRIEGQDVPQLWQ